MNMPLHAQQLLAQNLFTIALIISSSGQHAIPRVP